MATMYQRIQEAARKNRPIGPGDSRSKTTPSFANAGTGINYTDPSGRISISTLNGDGITKTIDNPTDKELATGRTPQVNQQYQPSDTQKAADQLQQEEDLKEKRRPKGRASTLLTGGSGLLDAPNLARRSLLAY